MSDGARDLTTAIGAISGTSMDGIDVALIRSDGEARLEAGPGATYPYPAEVAAALRAVVADPARAAGPLAELEAAVTDAHVAAVERFLAEFAVDRREVEIVGLHGQTVLHRPRERFTRQLCDGARAAAALAIDVVSDFRSADVAAGGEGAPLAPLYHAAMCAALDKPVMVLNWGGVGNVTYLGASGEIVAFDTGPANALIDDFVARRLGASRDEDGRLAAAGRVDAAIVAALMRDPYFDRPPPKSLDRNHFHAAARRGRTLERRRRRGDARRLHHRSDGGGGASFRLGAHALAGLRRRPAEPDADEGARRPARGARSNRSRRSASTATSSRRSASPISPCARARACRSRCRPRPARRGR